MFKKPLKDTKTSAPLRGSDRRRLRQRIVDAFCPNIPEDGDLLVPEGTQSLKIITSSGEQGTVYSSPEGDPLWFVIGKGSDELVPTVYTLWKRPALFPFVVTPSAVIPILMNGADLMVAGVVRIQAVPKTDMIVYVTAYIPDSIGPALAVGRMLVDAGDISTGKVTKGKAVEILHVYKDFLWSLGSKAEPPANLPPAGAPKEEDPATVGGDIAESLNETIPGVQASQPLPLPSGDPPDAETSERNIAVIDDEVGSVQTLTPEEVSDLLREALLQAVKTSLASLPQSTFPIIASTFYSTHVLPARAIHITDSATPVDIKHSTFKSLTVFLKQFEKQGILKLKEVRGELNVTSVSPNHEAVRSQPIHRTIGELESEQKIKRERDEKREQQKEAKEKELVIIELWKPHQSTVKLFQEAKLDTSLLYTLSDLRSALNKYVAEHDLINRTQQQFINADADPVLRDALWPRASKTQTPIPELAKREELLIVLCERMQPWHRVEPGKGAEPVMRKGQLKRIVVEIKIRQGRKACTLITGHEQYLLSSSEIAEALRSRCASSTAVSPLPGKSTGEEVMVQGKQIKTVVQYLEEAGIPKKWIDAVDSTEKKKK